MSYVEYFATVLRSDGDLHVLFKPTKQPFCKIENRGRHHPAAFTDLSLGDVDVPAKKLLEERVVRSRAARPELVAFNLVLLGESALNSVCHVTATYQGHVREKTHCNQRWTASWHIRLVFLSLLSFPRIESSAEWAPKT